MNVSPTLLVTRNYLTYCNLTQENDVDEEPQSAPLKMLRNAMQNLLRGRFWKPQPQLGDTHAIIVPVADRVDIAATIQQFKRNLNMQMRNEKGVVDK